jgi:chromosome segregation ATPase
MKNERSGLPIFLENSPSVICDQVLWLIKNSGLNFQVRETPFSLDINLKKRIANLWNQRNEHPVSNQSPSHVSSQHHENHVSQESQILENKSELLSKIDSLRANLEETSLHKNEASRELFELDLAHRKLLKENKELLKKHERVCSELKAVKEEKEKTAKENNSLSVALKASRKTLEESSGNFKKETNLYKDELEKLNQFKLERYAEMRSSKGRKETKAKRKKGS